MSTITKIGCQHQESIDLKLIADDVFGFVKMKKVMSSTELASESSYFLSRYFLLYLQYSKNYNAIQFCDATLSIGGQFQARCAVLEERIDP